MFSKYIDLLMKNMSGYVMKNKSNLAYSRCYL